jgi:hypothetical protein
MIDENKDYKETIEYHIEYDTHGFALITAECYNPECEEPHYNLIRIQRQHVYAGSIG